MGRFRGVLEGAAGKTDAELASEISSLTRLKDTDINEIAPHQADKAKLLKLLEIVDKASDENEVTAALQNNMAELSGTVLRLIKVLL